MVIIGTPAIKYSYKTELTIPYVYKSTEAQALYSKGVDTRMFGALLKGLEAAGTLQLVCGNELQMIQMQQTPSNFNPKGRNVKTGGFTAFESFSPHSHIPIRMQQLLPS